MLVTPARPVERDPMDSEACGAVLDALMSGENQERRELLAAGVSISRVNALYPLDLNHFVHAIMHELQEHGTRHLRADVVTQAQWHANYAHVSKIAHTLPPAERGDYEGVWNKLSRGTGIDHELMLQVYEGLQGWHPTDYASMFSIRFVHIFVALHWLAARDENPKWASEHRALQAWAVSALLPAETAYVNSR